MICMSSCTWRIACRVGNGIVLYADCFLLEMFYPVGIDGMVLLCCADGKDISLVEEVGGKEEDWTGAYALHLDQGGMYKDGDIRNLKVS